MSWIFALICFWAGSIFGLTVAALAVAASKNSEAEDKENEILKKEEK